MFSLDFFIFRKFTLSNSLFIYHSSNYWNVRTVCWGPLRCPVRPVDPGDTGGCVGVLQQYSSRAVVQPGIQAQFRVSVLGTGRQGMKGTFMLYTGGVC
jgi:hypothetical protein